MLTVATSSPCSSGWLRICLISLAFSVSFSSSALARACRSVSCCSQAINHPDLSIYCPRQVSERSFVQAKKQTHTQEPIEWKVKRVRLNSSQWRHKEMASTCFPSPTTNFFIICKENLCTPSYGKQMEINQFHPSLHYFRIWISIVHTTLKFHTRTPHILLPPARYCLPLSVGFAHVHMPLSAVSQPEINPYKAMYITTAKFCTLQ